MYYATLVVRDSDRVIDYPNIWIRDENETPRKGNKAKKEKRS